MITYKPSFTEEEIKVEVSIILERPDIVKTKNQLKLLIKAASILSLVYILGCVILKLWGELYFPILILICSITLIPVINTSFTILAKPKFRKQNSRNSQLQIEYILDNEAVTIKTIESSYVLKWHAFEYYGRIGSYIYLMINQDKYILVNTGKLSNKEVYEFNYLLKQVKRREDILFFHTATL